MILLLLSLVVNAWTQDQEIASMLAQDRTFLLDFIARPFADGEVEIINWEHASPQQQKLLRNYQQHIFPLEQLQQYYQNQINTYQLLLDRALFNSEEERSAWKGQILQISHQREEILNADDYRAAINQNELLAHELSGELAVKAHQMYADGQQISDNPASSAWWQQMVQLYQEITDQMKSLPLAKNLEKNFQQTNQLVSAFHQGPIAYSNQVASKLRPQLNELAILRTRWAQSQGFAHWGAYIHHRNQRNYAPELQTAAAKITMLEELLTQLRGPTQTLLPPSLERRSQVELLLPADQTLIAEFFPRDRIFSIWQDAMKQLGFSHHLLDAGQFDLLPRPNKFTNAYMVDLQRKLLKHLTVDATTLNIVNRQQRHYPTPVIRVIANFLGDGIIPLLTMMHEGGHLLDFFYHLPGLNHFYSNAFAETHSKFMELFLEEASFLLHYGKNAQGEKINPALVQKYLQNRAINKLFFWQEAMIKALYDLKIWDQAYYPDGVQFVDQCHNIAKNLEQQFSPLPRLFPENVDYHGAYFRTTHFISGNISYYGYILADISAFLSYQHLQQQLAKTTGQKELFPWPKLAKQLINGLYQFGNDYPFPTNIEQFVGARFSPKKYARDLVKKAQHFSPRGACQELITALGLESNIASE